MAVGPCIRGIELVVILFGGEAALKCAFCRPRAGTMGIPRGAADGVFSFRTSRPLRRVAQWVTNFSLRAVAPVPAKAPSGLSDAEYQELLEMAYQQGALAAGDKEIILQIINLDRRRAGEVMKARHADGVYFR